jgi:hypothetical protein
MKTLFQISLVALIGVLAAKLILAQTVVMPQTFIRDGERVLLLKGRVADQLKTWLVIEAHNGAQWKERGYDPSFTRVVCDFKPLFRKLPHGNQWEIMFTAENTK